MIKMNNFIILFYSFCKILINVLQFILVIIIP